MTDYERHADLLDMPVKENPGVPSVPRFLAIAAATLVVIGGIGTIAIRVVMADANARAVPQMARDIALNRSDINRLQDDVQGVKERRAEDIGEMRSMRAEILSRLDHIDNKLDSKADKAEAVKGWTR